MVKVRKRLTPKVPSGLPPALRYKVKKGPDEVQRLGIPREFDPPMVALARDVGTIGDRNSVMPP